MKNVIIIGMVGINVKATIAIATPSIERLGVIIGIEVEFLFWFKIRAVCNCIL